MNELETDRDEIPAESAPDQGSPYASLTFRRYQNKARATAGHHATMASEVTNWSLGLCGEAGEVAEHIKKHVFHGHPLPGAALAKELGDVLWYTTMMAQALGLDLEQIARGNLEKLHARYPGGFSAQHSLDRSAEEEE